MSKKNIAVHLGLKEKYGIAMFVNGKLVTSLHKFSNLKDIASALGVEVWYAGLYELCYEDLLAMDVPDPEQFIGHFGSSDSRKDWPMLLPYIEDHWTQIVRLAKGK